MGSGSIMMWALGALAVVVVVADEVGIAVERGPAAPLGAVGLQKTI